MQLHSAIGREKDGLLKQSLNTQLDQEKKIQNTVGEMRELKKINLRRIAGTEIFLL